MRIKDIERGECYRVETDDPDWSSYRRNAPNSWENLMGSSWEDVYDCEELEKAFQEYIKNQSP